LCRDGDRCNVGTPNDTRSGGFYSAAMQSTTTTKEADMFKKHLTRLSVMVITCSILVASFAPMALACVKVKF
jgi:hypothetical protein